MGVEHIAVVLHHSTLTGTAKLVLVGIANHAGDGGAWPSIGTLARYAGCSERTVQRCIGEAVAAGELAVKVNGGGPVGARADRRPNRYDVLVTCGPDCAGGPWHRRRGEAVEGAPAAAGVGQTDTAYLPEGEAAGAVDASPVRGDTGVGASAVRGDTGVGASAVRGDVGVGASAVRGDTGDVDGVTLVSPETSLETSFTSSMCNADASHDDSGGRGDDPAGFADFWGAWPGRRAHRRRAVGEWRRAVARAGGVDVILAGVARLAADPHLPTDRRMVPLPAAWLAGDCWTDESYLPAGAEAPARGPRVPVPPRFDREALGLPADGVPMPDYVRAAIGLTAGGDAA